MMSGEVLTPLERTSTRGAKSLDGQKESSFDEFFSGAGGKSAEPLADLSPSERELLRELVHGLRSIRYGSIVLTVHEGRLVEINKTVRIRRNHTNHREKE
jgi:hypothetical protein